MEEAPRGHGESPPGIRDVPIPQPTDQVQGPIPQGGQGRPYLPPRAAQYFLPRSHIPRRDPSPSRAPKSSIATIPTKGNLRPLRPRGSGTRAMIRPRRLWGWTSSLMPHLLAPDSPRLYPFVRTLKSPGLPQGHHLFRPGLDLLGQDHHIHALEHPPDGLQTGHLSPTASQPLAGGPVQPLEPAGDLTQAVLSRHQGQNHPLSG